LSLTLLNQVARVRPIPHPPTLPHSIFHSPIRSEQREKQHLQELAQPQNSVDQRACSEQTSEQHPGF
jgi:hypothetical protein